MVKLWVNLARVTLLMLGMMIFVPSVVMAQSSPSSQQTEAQRLYEEGEELSLQVTKSPREQ